MHISGSESSSLTKQCILVGRKDVPKKCQNKLKPNGCDKPTKLLFQSILNTEKVDALKTLDRRILATCALGGHSGPQAVTLTKWFKYEKKLLLRCIHNLK